MIDPSSPSQLSLGRIEGGAGICLLLLFNIIDLQYNTTDSRCQIDGYTIPSIPGSGNEENKMCLYHAVTGSGFRYSMHEGKGRFDCPHRLFGGCTRHVRVEAMGNLGLPRSERKPPPQKMPWAWMNLGLAGEKTPIKDGREEKASGDKKQGSETTNSDTSIPACQRHTSSCGGGPEGDEQF
jgi:hypothetical protein